MKAVVRAASAGLIATGSLLAIAALPPGMTAKAQAMLVPADQVPLPRSRPLSPSVGTTIDITPFAPSTPSAVVPSTDRSAIGSLIDGLLAPGTAALPDLSAPPEPEQPPPARAQTFDNQISQRDKQLTGQALRAIFSDDFRTALSLRDQVGHPVAKTLIEFYYVRDSSLDASPQRMIAFTQAHPDWPLSLIHDRLERALLIKSAPAETTLAAFRTRSPESGPGKAAYAIALAASGDSNRARRLAQEAWRFDSFDQDEARTFLSRGGSLLSRDDHKFRMDRLLYNDRVEEGLRVARLIGGDQVRLAEARAVVSRRQSNALSALDALPSSLKRDPLWAFSRIQATRRADRDEAAARLLLEAPRDPNALVDPDEWWVERRLAARHMVEAGDPRMAYQIAAQHAARSAASQSEAEFHAGWIALRFLNDPATAIRHFERQRRVVRTPISIARGEYWLGRANAAQGIRGRARHHYSAAAQFGFTYYGQLAAEQLGQRSIRVNGQPTLSRAAQNRFNSRGTVMAMKLLRELGYSRHPVPFFIDLTVNETDQTTLALFAELAGQMGLHDRVISIGKRGLNLGLPFEAYAFTRGDIPARVDTASLEPALVYAITRQESTFNTGAVSPAGARGLMQLMPGTAQAVSRQLGVGYSQNRLTSDPGYNVTLGSRYLAGRINDFNGSYVLAIASYNAGKSRADQWMARFGDPRTGGIDVVDWIELIPFTETRNYVQRVMENVIVYREVLGTSSRLNITADLQRGGQS
ncbi:MAG: lytic transglycosylase domain-containing protein [Pseudomonadota bacterium]